MLKRHTCQEIVKEFIQQRGDKLMFIVTNIEVYENLDEDIQFKIDNGLGVWSSKDHEIGEDVRKYMLPYTLRKVEYEKNKPHKLTSFK
ncbi:MAG: hypothetical protein CM15mV34_0110 [Caudoviricetes sp.]|nr:MAG: hypothetical protein CM15mV34_0110 [Caudoviricetes sp.]